VIMNCNKTSILKQLVTLFFIMSLLFFLASGCSHKTPYYDPEFDRNQPILISQDKILQRFLLIGDTGEPGEPEPVLETLRKWASQKSTSTMVIFLGDNIYPSGLPDESHPKYNENLRKIRAQVEVVKRSGARAVFIPGNHDWVNGGETGLQAIQRQRKYIIGELNDEKSFLPADVCPGPAYLDFSEVRLIILDTDFWINKKLLWDSNCPQSDKESFLEKYKKLITTAGEKEVVVVAHHPLDSHGPHGGFFDWKDHIFPLTRLENWLWVPLPIIGSLYPLTRWYLIEYDEDLNSTIYREMIEEFSQVMSGQPPLIYAAGHDHNLQVLQGGSSVEYILVSGAGSQSEITNVGHGDNTLFAHLHTGFMAVDFLEDGRVLLQVIEPSDKEVVFQKWLK